MRLVWALFGNDEDGPYGCGTKWNPSCEKTVGRAIRWWFRNPMHNLMHHVIGIYGETFESVIMYENNPGWSKSLRINLTRSRIYPYWNYRGHGFQFYIGWRDSGAFGIALRRRSK